MRITDLAIPGVKLIEPFVHGDARGFLMETFRQSAIAAAGGPRSFVQDNQTLSTARFTVRGMHFQIPPHAQAKLVRVLRGSILDVAVDIRVGSPTFRRHVAVELGAGNRRQLLVPAGCAHGFCTLEPDTEVFYKIDREFAREAERGFHWRDPCLDAVWPVGPEEAVLSERDRALPALAALPEFFRWSAAT
jgi:dTDP-4-dehydrorhamnose 3,5-epimerase